MNSISIFKQTLIYNRLKFTLWSPTRDKCSKYEEIVYNVWKGKVLSTGIKLWHKEQRNLSRWKTCWSLEEATCKYRL